MKFRLQKVGSNTFGRALTTVIHMTGVKVANKITVEEPADLDHLLT